MSGWLLFFLFLTVIGCPSATKEKRAAVVVAGYVCWTIATVALAAAALRTGGYL